MMMAEAAAQEGRAPEGPLRADGAPAERLLEEDRTENGTSLPTDDVREAPSAPSVQPGAVKAESLDDDKVKDLVRAYLATKSLEEVSVKDVREHLLAATGTKLEKSKVKVLVQAVLLEDADEDEDVSAEEESGGEAAPSKKKSGFNKEQVLSSVLAEFMGVDESSRPQVVKKLWEYIKANGLQNPNDKREILCDETLQKLFNRKSVTMFSMNKFLAPHIKSKDGVTRKSLGYDAESPSKKRPAKSKPKAPAAKKKRRASSSPGATRKPSGFSKPIKISATLSSFMGGQEMAARGEVVKSLWAYIKENNLQDPENKKNIRCDDTLKALLGQEMVTSFSMNKFIQPHFVKE